MLFITTHEQMLVAEEKIRIQKKLKDKLLWNNDAQAL